MRILHLSDTHNQHRQLKALPEADIIIHSGDFTLHGTEEEALDFMKWFCDLPYPHKIFIAGNHDLCMYEIDSIEGLPDNVHYLCNQSIKIQGVTFYGIPYFINDCKKGLYESFFELIPPDTDVLVTHQPPYGICDEADYGTGESHHGNKKLAECVSGLNVKYHLFGHEHDANGVIKKDGIVFSNASLVNHNFKMYARPRLFQYQ